MEWDPVLGSTMLTMALGDPQSWMALLRREIGHFHEKKELPLDTRWAKGYNGWVAVPAPGGLAQNPLHKGFYVHGSMCAPLVHMCALLSCLSLFLSVCSSPV